MFRTAVHHCKFAQRWSEKTDIPDISLPYHRQDDLHPLGGYFSSPSGEKEPEHPGYSEGHATFKTSPWNAIWKEIWSRQTVWEGYQPSRNFELWIDRILTQKRFFETRRDGVNFDFKLKSSIFSLPAFHPILESGLGIHEEIVEFQINRWAAFLYLFLDILIVSYEFQFHHICKICHILQKVKINPNRDLCMIPHSKCRAKCKFLPWNCLQSKIEKTDNDRNIFFPFN